MKPIRFIVTGLAIAMAGIMQAQVSINVNIGARPAWGPVVEAEVRYYYLPEVDAYYDLNSSMFIYLYGGHWIHRHHLPVRYRNYDLYHGRKVVVYDYRGNSPYAHCKYHVKNYRSGRDYNRVEVRRPERSYYKDYDHDNRRSRGYYSGDHRKNRNESNIKYAQGREKGHWKEKGRRD